MGHEKRPEYTFNENETSRHLQVTNTHAERYENRHTNQIEKRPAYYIFRWERSARLSTYALMNKKKTSTVVERHYGVATISRLLKIIGLFCKRAL